MNRSVRIGLFGGLALAGIALTVFGIVIGSEYQTARNADTIANDALAELVLSYSERNDLIPNRIRSKKIATKGIPESSLTAEDPKVLRALEQTLFSNFDRREQELLGKLATGPEPKGIAEASKWLAAEKRVVEARKKYTDAAALRNEAWGKVPTWLRSGSGIRPMPHFQADLAEWKANRNLVDN